MPLSAEHFRLRVESAEPYGWVVYREGARRTQFFGQQDLAFQCAKRWARAQAPSTLDVVDLAGQVTGHWVFEEELACPASRS